MAVGSRQIRKQKKAAESFMTGCHLVLTAYCLLSFAVCLSVALRKISGMG
jgi:hypothetical protein